MANSENTTIRTFEFKLRLNNSFVDACERELEHSRQIYNAALAERISCYRITGASLGYTEQSRHLTEARTLPEVKSHLRTIQQDALERVDEAFNGFFRRVRNGEKPGFPRFKGKDRYHTFSQKYERVRPCPIKGDKLTVPGVGSCRVRLSRPIEGQCKQLRITRRVDGWYVLLVCEAPKPEPMPTTGQTVGVDVGGTIFLIEAVIYIINLLYALGKQTKAIPNVTSCRCDERNSASYCGGEIGCSLHVERSDWGISGRACTPNLLEVSRHARTGENALRSTPSVRRRSCLLGLQLVSEDFNSRAAGLGCLFAQNRPTARF